MSRYSFVKKALNTVPDTVETPSLERKEFTAKFTRFMMASERLEKANKKWGKAQGGFSVKANDATGTLAKGQKIVADYSDAKRDLENLLEKLPNADAFVSNIARALDSFSITSQKNAFLNLAGKAAYTLRNVWSAPGSATAEAAKKTISESPVGRYSQAVAVEAGLPEVDARRFALLVIKHGADYEKEANWKPLLEFMDSQPKESFGKLESAAIQSKTKIPGVDLFHMLEFVRMRKVEAYLKSPL